MIVKNKKKVQKKTQVTHLLYEAIVQCHRSMLICLTPGPCESTTTDPG